MTHECNRQGEINEIKKALFGNGKPGLKEVVIRIEENLKHREKLDTDLSESVKGLTTVVSGLVKFQSEMIGEKKKDKIIRWIIGVNIPVLLACLGWIILLLR